MSKLGFYGWIREGVRRAVLMGLSDAVEQIGSVNEQEEMHPQLLSVLRQGKPLLSHGNSAEAPSHESSQGSRPSRKRLGKSLNSIVNGAAGTAPLAAAREAAAG